MQCFVSLVQATNETLNFWTHFLPALYFWYQFAYFMPFISEGSLPVSVWPFCAYMITLSVFPIASACSHAFNAMSNSARHVCFFVDYYAISLFIVGSSLAYVSYALPCRVLVNREFQTCFICGSVLVAFISLSISCHTRFVMGGVARKALRFLAFALPYLYVSVPVTYRLLHSDANEGFLETQARVHYTRQFVLAVLSGFFYTTHMPESIFPGRFDVLGHSHQLFHLCSALGVREQFLGLWNDMMSARQHCFGDDEIQLKLAREDLPEMVGSLGTMAIVVSCGLAIVAAFVWRVWTREQLSLLAPPPPGTVLILDHTCVSCATKNKSI